MRTIVAALAAVCFAVPVHAGEMVKGANYFVRDAQDWPTGEKTSYWRVTNTGISQSTEGPLETGSITCIGAGFYGPNGATGEDICIQGEGEDTWTSTWQHNSSGGTWEIVHGTGKLAGITGSGTYENNYFSQTRTINNWEGDLTLP